MIKYVSLLTLLLLRSVFGYAQVDLPITFQDTATVDYTLMDFGGNASSIVADPTNASNLVGKAIKTAGAELWAGTTNGGNGLASAIPFTSTDTKMSVRVWSPDANTPIRLKVENVANGSIYAETEATTTAAASWETLEFNFSNPAAGTATLNVANTYDKVSIFFNFGTTGTAAGEKTYYWDDVEFIAGGGINKAQADLPITFQDTATVNYALVDFGGNVSSVVVDPTNSNNLVAKAIKTAGAEVWAGTTIGGNGLANAIPFTAGSTKMTVRVWSPDANTPILLKVEDAANPAISVETKVNTTAAATWETLEFNFSNHESGTPALNLANRYNKVSIFFNFGTNGATAGEKTYYWHDVRFGGLLGIDKLEASAGGIRIYPNPASDALAIEFEEQLKSPAQLSIWDANGRLVKSFSVTAQQAVCDLQGFSGGMYYVEIKNESGNYFQKLVIVK
ncbi:MAG: T9SS C-terminal target domain-containing protein [Bacteroidetes bacterium]|nr:MAG: T9SS C-terminal target domain-containing protein [Bacteroidota bacterium]